MTLSAKEEGLVISVPAMTPASVATEIADDDSDEGRESRWVPEGMETEFVPGIGKEPIMAETRNSEKEIVNRRRVIVEDWIVFNGFFFFRYERMCGRESRVDIFECLFALRRR